MHEQSAQHATEPSSNTVHVPGKGAKAPGPERDAAVRRNMRASWWIAEIAEAGERDEEDARQAGIVGLLEAIDSWDGVEPWEAHAKRCVKPRVREATREAEARQRRYLVPDESELQDPAADPMTEQDRAALLEAAGLNEHEAQALQMLFDEVTVEDTARALGVTRRSVERYRTNIAEKIERAREARREPRRRPRCTLPPAAGVAPPKWRLPTEEESEAGYKFAKYKTSIALFGVVSVNTWAKGEVYFVTAGQWELLERGDVKIEDGAGWPEGSRDAFRELVYQQARLLKTSLLGEHSQNKRKRLIGRGLLNKDGSLTPFGAVVERKRVALAERAAAKAQVAA